MNLRGTLMQSYLTELLCYGLSGFESLNAYSHFTKGQYETGIPQAGAAALIAVVGLMHHSYRRHMR